MDRSECRPWAVVTGSSSGIGRATALELARQGWNIVVHYRKSKGAAQDVAEEITQLGSRAEIISADFSQPAKASEFVQAVCDAIGIPAAWVHLAGVDLLTGEFANAPYERKLRLATDVDLIGTMESCRLIGIRMKEKGAGSIVTIGWDQSATGMEGESGQIFAATKAGIEAFTRSLAKTLAPTVRVNCVSPGWIQTAWGENASLEWQRRVIRETPLARWGQPQDVADVIAFLVSEKGAFLTGQTIRVNGGVVMS